jgi:hypothetical protein
MKQMRTLIVSLLLAVSLLAQDNPEQNCDGGIPIPNTYAYQLDGGILCGTEPITLCDGGAPDLYYVWRNGSLVYYGQEASFVDYPGIGVHVYQMQIAVGWVAGDLSEPVTVEIVGELPPPTCECYGCCYCE